MCLRNIYITLFFVWFSSANGETNPFDFITPCSSKDTPCILQQWTDTLYGLAKGRPDLNLAALDPLKVEDVMVEVPSMVYLRFNGLVKGFKDCSFDNAKTHASVGHFKLALDLHCNISIKGNYDANANATLLFGNQGLITSSGDGKVKLYDLKFKFLIDFNVIKGKDGVIKLKMKEGPFDYKYAIGGPVVFYGDHVYIGKEDITNLAITFVNQNWKFVMDVFGGFFIEKAIYIISDIQRAFFDIVPASVYLSDNLEKYAIEN